MTRSAGDAPTFTVFTATYNRAHTLSRVFDSLRAQTDRDFEWLVVDDGSTDGTAELVREWSSTCDFPIRYVHQENAGKPAAYNAGIAHARGHLFVTLDSDDECEPRALERFRANWQSIPEEDRAWFVGVSALARTRDGALRGTPFPRDVLDSDSIELRFRYRVVGDTWSANRTEVLRDYPFPVSTENRFVSEGVVWYEIARTFKTRFVNEALLIYHIDDGADDHLSGLRLDLIPGRLAYHEYVLNNLDDWWFHGAREYAKSAVNYSRYSYDLGRRAGVQLRGARTFRARAALAAAIPAGAMFARRDRAALRSGT